MSMTHKPRWWRFHFSLRTLIIFVLVYCGLWVLTYTVGAQQLAQRIALRYRAILAEGATCPYNYSVEVNGTSLKYCVPADGRMFVYKGEGFSPAPFILIWKTRMEANFAGFDPTIETRFHVYGWLGGVSKDIDTINLAEP